MWNVLFPNFFFVEHWPAQRGNPKKKLVHLFTMNDIGIIEEIMARL